MGVIENKQFTVKNKKEIIDRKLQVMLKKQLKSFTKKWKLSAKKCKLSAKNFKSLMKICIQKVHVIFKNCMSSTKDVRCKVKTKNQNYQFESALFFGLHYRAINFKKVFL